MPDRVPSFFMLVPGPWQTAAEVRKLLEGAGIACASGDAVGAGEIGVDVIADDALGAQLRFGRLGPMPDDLLAQIDACAHAALLEVGRLLHEDPLQTALLGRVLQAAGGVALRMEASGGAWAWEPWLERMESQDPWGLCQVALVFVGDGDNTFFTAGMHHFDLPDAEITGLPGEDAVPWLEQFHVFQLAESPVLGSGHTFRPSLEVAQRVLERWPDGQHDPDDGRHNPFGVWRFLPEGQTGLEVRNPVPTIMPSLVAMLAHAESRKGAPLTRDEVRRLVDDAPAIAMPLEDLGKFERARGYADIEPELAWEQWQVVR